MLIQGQALIVAISYGVSVRGHVIRYQGCLRTDRLHMSEGLASHLGIRTSSSLKLELKSQAVGCSTF